MPLLNITNFVDGNPF